MSTLHPIFSECLGSGLWSCKYGDLINRPFVLDGHIYAVNGNICVRQPTDASAETAPVPPCDELGWDRVRKPASLPGSVEKQRYETCATCEGSGEYMCNCPKCGEQHTCVKCDGSGKTPAFMMPYEIPGTSTIITHRYAELLIRNGARIQCEDDPTRPVYFTIPGTDIEGMVASSRY